MKKTMLYVLVVLLTATAMVTISCGDDDDEKEDGNSSDSDADGDTDGDADGGTGGDADSDADGDTGGDADSDADGDTGGDAYDCDNTAGDPCAMIWCNGASERQTNESVCEQAPSDSCDAVVTCYEEYLDCIAKDCTKETASDVSSTCATTLNECTSAANQ